MVNRVDRKGATFISEDICLKQIQKQLLYYHPPMADTTKRPT